MGCYNFQPRLLLFCACDVMSFERSPLPLLKGAMENLITTVDQLEAIYGQPAERAVRKEIDYLNEDYQAFVAASPFLVLASAGTDGMDCSPKGDPAGFVRILDERTLAIPDRPGNNRIDNLRNIVADARVSLLFIIPGVGETLRVNGRSSPRRYLSVTMTSIFHPSRSSSFQVDSSL